jgi:stage III sporulation protein SpoIIIAA
LLTINNIGVILIHVAAGHQLSQLHQNENKLKKHVDNEVENMIRCKSRLRGKRQRNCSLKTEQNKAPTLNFK